MNDALSLINYVFTKFLDLLFNRLEISSNVTIGWILVVIVIFGIMISNILSVARSSQSHIIERNKE